MDQLVIRNRGEYVITVNTNLDFNMDYLPYLVPESSSPDVELKYFVKNFLPDGRLVIKLVVYEGIDTFGRHVMKSHNLIFNEQEYRNQYLKNGLPYYITPLLDNHLTSISDDLLRPEQFRKPDISKIKPHYLLYDLLCYNKVSVHLDAYHPHVVMILFSVLDYALPDEINNQVTIQSYISESMKDHLDASIAFLHTTTGSDRRVTKNRTENAFIKEYLDNLNSSDSRKRYQRDLMLGNISDANLTAKFRKAYHVSKDGTVLPPKKNILSILKDRVKFQHD
ncbi:MAG: hypothetical protein ACXAEU_23655 [Candidatus Hodarchaeales archaeon]|jgi:hypothetical protein